MYELRVDPWYLYRSSSCCCLANSRRLLANTYPATDNATISAMADTTIPATAPEERPLLWLPELLELDPDEGNEASVGVEEEEEEEVVEGRYTAGNVVWPKDWQTSW